MSRAHDQPVNSVQALFDGPIDVVGDVHGEWQALRSLLNFLGYDAYGEHRAGRRLVFVGDLCDRGPDSPQVIDFVQGLCQRQLAQCVLGNHELNLLRQERKPGNGWYFEEHADHARPEFRSVRRANEREREQFRIFCSQLPLALQRADLRIAHAAWHAPSLASITAQPNKLSLLDLYQQYELQVQVTLTPAAAAAAADEKMTYAGKLYDPHANVPFLPHLAHG